MSTSAASHSEMSSILELVPRAFALAQSAAGTAAKALGDPLPDPAETVRLLRACEGELDTLDREVDERSTKLITKVSESEARELLASMKLMVALERIGDLLLSFGNRVEAIGAQVEAEDRRLLSAMAERLESMLTEAEGAFRQRNLDLAVSVLRSDAELDRLRNLTVLHHVESPHEERRPVSFHVLFMAQGLERAGDHAKNVAEEICHLVSGRTVRHVLRSYDRPDEQRFIDRLRARHLDKP